jgi:hypothetical protein
MSTAVRRAVAWFATFTGGAVFIACFPTSHATRISLAFFTSALITVALSVGYLRRPGGHS